MVSKSVDPETGYTTVRMHLDREGSSFASYPIKQGVLKDLSLHHTYDPQTGKVAPKEISALLSRRKARNAHRNGYKGPARVRNTRRRRIASEPYQRAGRRDGRRRESVRVDTAGAAWPRMGSSRQQWRPWPTTPSANADADPIPAGLVAPTANVEQPAATNTEEAPQAPAATPVAQAQPASSIVDRISSIANNPPQDDQEQLDLIGTVMKQSSTFQDEAEEIKRQKNILEEKLTP